MASRRMRVFAFDFQGPAHLSAGLWRHEQDHGARYKDLRYWTDYAKLLEEARFDGIFSPTTSATTISTRAPSMPRWPTPTIPPRTPSWWSRRWPVSPKTSASA